MKPTALQFELIAGTSLKPQAKAIRMWCAVWANRGRGECYIGAPTLDALQKRWEQITSSDFDRSAAQAVYVYGGAYIVLASDAQHPEQHPAQEQP